MEVLPLCGHAVHEDSPDKVKYIMLLFCYIVCYVTESAVPVMYSVTGSVYAS